MNNDVDPKDLAILVQAGLNEKDIEHSVLVAQKAIDIARRTGKDLDMDLIRRGALFHDLGKALTHSYQHGEIGAEIAERYGLPPAIADIARKHFHGGITPDEARTLRLPARDYTPHRLEERIILYADRLVDIITEGYVELRDDQEAEDRFEDIITHHIRYGKDTLTSARYLEYHREISLLVSDAGKDTRGHI